YEFVCSFQECPVEVVPFFRFRLGDRREICLFEFSIPFPQAAFVRAPVLLPRRVSQHEAESLVCQVRLAPVHAADQRIDEVVAQVSRFEAAPPELLRDLMDGLCPKRKQRVRCWFADLVLHLEVGFVEVAQALLWKEREVWKTHLPYASEQAHFDRGSRGFGDKSVRQTHAVREV